MFVYFWIKLLFQGYRFTIFPKKFCISDFLLLALILFKSAPRLSVFVSSAFSQVNIRFVFRNAKCLSHFFTFKDRISNGFKSHVACTALYVGHTTRNVHTQVSDRLGISALTGEKHFKISTSGVLSHLSEIGHSVSLDNLKILSSCSSASDLLIRENLLNLLQMAISALFLFRYFNTFISQL